MKDTAHVRLHAYLLNGAAYRSLSPFARAGLVELYALYNGSNNGEIFLSERELGRRLGVDRRTARKALADLADRGFIAATEQGGFVRKVRHATCWRLTEHPCNGRLATKDFMQWRYVAEDIRARAGRDAGSATKPIRRAA